MNYEDLLYIFLELVNLKIKIHLWMGRATIRMNFPKRSKVGEGSFAIQKFIMQILGTLNKAF